MSDDDLPAPDQAPGAPHPRETPVLFGQDEAQADFLNAFSTGRMHHGWLLTGPEGVGKATLAWRIARFLLATPPTEDDGLFGAPPPPETLDIDPDHPVSRRILAGAEPGLAQVTRSANDQGRMREGFSVLVLGASGGVGHYAVQLARSLGASRIVGSCSAHNRDLVLSLGADTVLDYARGEVEALEERFDVVLDIAGGAPVSFLRRRIVPGGSVVLVGGPGDGLLLGPAARIFGGLLASRMRPERVVGVDARVNGPDLHALAALLASGELRSVLHRRVPLEETAQALAEVEAGHVPGKVVVVP